MSDKKKLLLALGGFALVGASLLFLYLFYVWAFAYRAENFDTQMAAHVRQLIDSQWQIEPKIIITGDSTASCGINAVRLPSAYSLAVVNSGPVESYFGLRDYLAAHAPPKCVVAAFSQDWPEYKIFFWKTFVRGRFFSAKDLGEIYDESKALGAYPGAVYGQTEYALLTALYRYKLAGLGLPEIQDSIFSPPQLATWLKIRHLNQNYGSWLLNKNLEKPPQKGIIPRGDADSLFKLYLQKLIDLAATNHIRFYLVEIPGPPVPEEKQEWLEGAVRARPENAVLDAKISFTEDDYSFPRHLKEPAANRLTDFVRDQIHCD